MIAERAQLVRGFFYAFQSYENMVLKLSDNY